MSMIPWSLGPIFRHFLSSSTTIGSWFWFAVHRRRLRTEVPTVNVATNAMLLFEVLANSCRTFLLSSSMGCLFRVSGLGFRV
jgi:hypothetical protein